MTETDERANAEQLERALASKASWALPGLTLLVSIGVGVGFGVGPAILVLAAGALVSVIGLLWASLRTLGGDAPLAEGLVTAAAMREDVSRLAERKRRVLRALKDLELEHSVGKIDDEDYAEISARYREQAKGLIREMDIEIEPLRPRAEAIARAHLEKRGVVTGKGVAKDPLVQDAQEEDAAIAASVSRPAPARERVACAHCAASNEPDAEFCKKCRARISRVVCPSCATSNEPDATFCKKCGASLGQDGHAKNDTVTEAKGA
jgi:ribosomal protein L40E